jgi:hypothetical protein
MTIRPILFSAPMIHALLDGRKAQTRRMKTKIQAADLLWVRETHCPYLDGEDFQKVDYRATPQWNESHPAGWHEDPKNPEALKWRPSIFMRRKHSRITLEVIEVRKERLQDISEQDAIAEGIAIYNEDDANLYYSALLGNENEWPNGWILDNPVAAYKELWESISGKGSWEANPEVFVITFKTYIKNIDEFLEERNAE